MNSAGRSYLEIAFKVFLFLLAAWIASVSLAGVLDPDLGSRAMRRLFETAPWIGYAHIVGGSLALILGGLQLSSKLRRYSLATHKTIGNVYVLCVMISTAGAVAHLCMAELSFALSAGFWLLAIVWPITTLAGYPWNGQFNFKRHGRLMFYSYAMTCAAITLRLWLMALMACGVAFPTAYPIAAWAGGVGNLLIVSVLLLVIERKSARQKMQATQLKSA